VRVSFDRAILGTVAEVATAVGSASVKIPPGTSSGKKLRLRGKGVAIDQRGPGDHYVTVHVDVPAELDDLGQQLLPTHHPLASCWRERQPPDSR
jgi:molecular chaperone DnaJ